MIRETAETRWVLGTLVLASCCALSGFVIRAQDEQPLIRQERGLASTAVTTISSATIDAGVRCDTVVSVSEPLMTIDGSGRIVRVVSLDAHLHLAQVSLGRRHALVTMEASDRAGVRTRVGHINPSLAKALAAELLEQSPEGLVEIGEAVPPHDLSVAPVEGLTWGQITSADDVSVRLTAAR